MRRWIRRIWIGGGLVFVLWLVWSMQAHGVSATVMTSTDSVAVVDSGEILQFRPRHPVNSAAGLLFLPGAMVQPSAYAPLLRAVADAGYPVAMVRLPWRSARSLSSQAVVWERIAAIIAQDPQRAWVLVGHSRGAALAAQFAGEHASTLGGLILIGTTHPKAASLANIAVPVTKIYGTRDCVADSSDVHANAKLLPPSTRFVELDGANHSQFGWYGLQLGDCRATITRQQQQERTRHAVIDALDEARKQ